MGSSSRTTPAPSVTEAQRARQRDALPLAAREIGSALVGAGQDGAERRQSLRSRGFERAKHHLVWRAGGRDVVPQRQLEPDEVLEDRGQPRPPLRHVQLAQVHAVHFDCAGLRVVEPAQQLRQGRLAGAVLPDDRQRRTGGDCEVESLEHRPAAGIGKGDAAEADVALRQRLGRCMPR